MAHKILKSLLPTEEHVNSFQRLCNTQIDEMRAHDKHMKMVAKDPKTYHPYPPPLAHPDIMASIVKDGDDYNIEFELLEEEEARKEIEKQSPPLTLEQKKSKLSEQVHSQAAQLQYSIVPPRKRTSLSFEHAKLLAISEDSRTKAQKTRIDEIQKLADAMNAVASHGAQLESEIEDLTEANIDKWKPSPFPEIKQ